MPDSATSVHTIETSVLSDNWPTYRNLRISLCSEEYKATMEMYSDLDCKHNKNRVELLTKCRTFAWFARSTETGRVHVCSNSCRQRWCPICATGKANYIVQSLSPWVQKIKNPRFLTLTLKHSNAPLLTQIDTLYKHFRNLRRDKQFKQYVTGGVWFFQVKLSSKSDQWHPHIHCLIKGKYLPHDWISRKWLRMTKTSNIVDIRAVKNKSEVAKYVARYCARPAKLSLFPVPLRQEIFEALHGRRLCGKWGDAKVISLSPPKFLPAEKYTRLGKWSTILSLKVTSAIARQIIKAWLEKLTIEPDVTLQPVEDFLDDIPSGHGTEADKYWERYLPGYS